MKRYLLILVTALTLCNATFAVAYACECTAKTGAKCTGQYCRTTADGMCQCQDVPFNTGGGGGFLPEEPINN